MTRRVVIVEDDETVRLLLACVVADTGHLQPVPLRDAAHLVEVVQSVRPALVLLDVMLPGQTGVEAVEMLRAAGERVPVLLLSAYVPANDPTGIAASLTDGGPTEFLAKPFDISALLEQIHALLSLEVAE